MDPYLEGELWSTVHGQLVAEIARQLAPRLRPKYLALMEKRFATADPEYEDGVSVSTPGGSWVVPDVGVVKAVTSGSSTVVAASVIAPLQVDTIMPEAVPQHWVEIRDTRNRQLVTVIEVLSPANKAGDGHAEYLARRQKLLVSNVHLIEIDLLRKGKRPPMRKRLPEVPYFVFLARAGNRPLTDVWPIRLDQSLPTIPVPLLPGDVDVDLDLELAFTTIYDQLGYDLAVNYADSPEFPLSSEDAAWARERIMRQSSEGKEAL
jgi:hypothetical protein